MMKPYRLGATLTAIGLVGSLAGCASSGQKTAMYGKTIFGTKIDGENIGLATRAQMALAANELPTAIQLAERAVENSPTDAGFRALLGNAYLASGRFASAEAAYADSLSLLASQPEVALKLALVQTAQGKNADALAVLTASQKMLDPADLGLAVALAGRPDQAVQVMEPAARAQDADARLRQNLALAYALAGNWEMSRTVVAQDVSGDQIEARLDQFRTLSKPGKPGTAVASFIGVTPAASDAGQPIRLAVNKEVGKARLAAAKAPAPVKAAVPAPAVVAPVLPAVAPVEVAAAPAPYQVTPTVARVEAVAPRPVEVAEVARPVRPVTPTLAAARVSQVRPALSPAAVRLSDSIPQIRKAALRTNGGSRAVVQLGAYSSRDRIGTAWTNASAKFASLRNYQPLSARFEGSTGTFYRLSIKGFASNREAFALCASIKRAGRPCFVRNESGDAPVEFASR